MKKICELCKCVARIYCESDQASLCWTCDAKVHSANFLVARHLRSLLCHSCQSPTPWGAAGEKLGRTVSMCERCVERCSRRKYVAEREESQGCNDGDFESESDYDTDEDCDGDGDQLDEKEVGDNQVVPWSSTLPPPAASYSGNEESSNGDIDVSSKRSRDDVIDLSSRDDLSCSSSQLNHQMMRSSERVAARFMGGGKDAFVDSVSLRPLKIRKSEANGAGGVQHTVDDSGNGGIVGALERFRQQDMTYSGNKASYADVDLNLCLGSSF